MSFGQLRKLLRLGSPVRYEAGSAIYREGSPGGSIMLIRRGQVVVSKSFFGKTSTLSEVGPGGLVGEVSFFEQGERSNSAQATTPTVVLEFPRASLQPILAEYPQLALFCLRQMAVRVRQVEQDLLEELVQRNLELELANARLEARIKERTELERSNQQLSHLAARDHLTGCLNRRALQERLTVWTADLELPFTLLLFDIDHFKHYNDRHGHLMGDQLLKSLVEVIGGRLRGNDLLARFGGEEFAVLLHGLHPEVAPEVANRLSQAVANHAFSERHTQPLGTVSVSAGLSFFPDEATSPDGLLQLADERLYLAKAAGRNRIESGPLCAREVRA